MKTVPPIHVVFLIFILSGSLFLPSIAEAEIFNVGAGETYTTIAQALAAAGDNTGDVINIVDSVHEEKGIVVNKTITILGRGMTATTIQAHALPGQVIDRVFTIDQGATVTLRNLAVIHGRIIEKPNIGGGILNNGILVMQRVRVKSNQAVGRNTQHIRGENAFGGGIYNNGILHLDECDICDNTAKGGDCFSTISAIAGESYGGGIYNAPGAKLFASKSTIHGNKVQGGNATAMTAVNGKSYGGGVCQAKDGTGELRLTNCTISGNIGRDVLPNGFSYGGGLYGSGDVGGEPGIFLVSCTVSQNSAYQGGGLASDTTTDNQGPHIQNTILSDNMVVVGGYEIFQRVQSRGYNLITTLDSATLDIEGNQNTDTGNIPGQNALLGILQDNGGLTPTHALLAGSPAKDAIPSGQSGMGSPPLHEDQRGVKRPLGAGGDIGAYEQPERIYVDAAAPAMGTGASWESPLQTIQAAIDMASSLEVPEIWVKQGNYQEAITMQSDISIYGGFDGSESSPGDRNIAAHPSKIDAGDLPISDHVVTMISITDTLLDGFTITGGDVLVSGGGIQCQMVDHTNTIANCIIESNYANSGGGIYLYSSSPKIANCQIHRNESSSGGGVYCFEDSSPILTGCIIKGNWANEKGGGVFCHKSVLTIRDSEIKGNEADFGAGLCADIGSISLTNCILSENYSKEGGAVFCSEPYSGIPGKKSGCTLINCTISQNSATSRGGGVFGQADCDITIRNTIFDEIEKYAIYQTEDTTNITISNSLFYSNSDGAFRFHDGAIFMDSQMDAYQGCVNGDPKFPTQVDFDFHIMSGSAAIDAGTAIEGLDKDKDGHPRPVDIPGVGDGLTFDIGAYELQSGPRLSVFPASLDFGKERVNNEYEAAEYLSLANIGTDSISFTEITLSGSTDFSFPYPPETSPLPAGESRDLIVYFDASSPGIKTADLTIRSNDLNDPTIIIPITGTGYNTSPLAGVCPGDRALDFAEEDDRVVITDFVGFPKDEFTISFWMKTNFKVHDMGIFSYNAEGAENEVLIYHINHMSIYVGNKSIDTGVSFLDNLWHHVAVTWRSSDGQLKLYDNGIEKFSGALSPLAELKGGGAVVFAEDQDAVASGYDPFQAYIGSLDEVRVWNRVRSREEIQAAMSRPLSGVDQGLVGYWRLDEGTYLDIYDSSPNANHGVTENFPKWLNASADSITCDDMILATDEDTETTVALHGSDAEDYYIKAFITRLLPEGSGELYQYDGVGVLGAKIDSVPAEVTDPEMRVYYIPANKPAFYTTFFEWQMFDGSVYSDNTATMTLSVVADNEPPVLDANKGLTALKGRKTVISNSRLHVSDTDHAPGDITYTVNVFPDKGDLLKDGTVMTPGDNTFTQADLDTGKVSYQHDGLTEDPDAFTFSVSDAAGGSIVNKLFLILVTTCEWSDGFMMY